MRYIGAVAALVAIAAAVIHVAITAYACTGENNTCGGSGTARYEGHLLTPEGMNAEANIRLHFLSLQGSRGSVSLETDDEGRFCATGPREVGPVQVEAVRVVAKGTRDVRLSDPEIASSLELSARNVLQEGETATAILFYERDAWLRLSDGPSTTAAWEPEKDQAHACVHVERGPWLRYADRWTSANFVMGIAAPLLALLLLLGGRALGTTGRLLQWLGVVGAVASPVLLVVQGG